MTDRVFGGASRCVYEINDSGDSTTRFRTLNLQGSSFFNSEELSMATGSSFTRISGLLAVIHRFDTFLQRLDQFTPICARIFSY